MRKLLIFDCDGTLIDTLHDVALCFNGALEQWGFPTYPWEAYSGFVGGNLETIVSRLLPEDARTEENVTRVKTAYRARYQVSDKPYTKPYEGILPMLSRLKARGYMLAVNTNKGQQLTDALIAELFPKDLFSSVVGYEELRPSKPDPHGVDLICAECGVERNDAVYIGDGASDIRTADNAGIPCVFVTWGQGSEEDRLDSRIAFRADTVSELEQILSEQI